MPGALPLPASDCAEVPAQQPFSIERPEPTASHESRAPIHFGVGGSSSPWDRPRHCLRETKISGRPRILPVGARSVGLRLCFAAFFAPGASGSFESYGRGPERTVGMILRLPGAGCGNRVGSPLSSRSEPCTVDAVVCVLVSSACSP
jgi:hypothetical protein